MVLCAVNAVIGLGWKGLSSSPELQGCATLIMPTDQAVSLQLTLAKEQELQEKQREFLWRISDAYDKAGYLDIAENRLKELLEQELSEEQQLEALCFLADIQVDCWLDHQGVTPELPCCDKWFTAPQKMRCDDVLAHSLWLSTGTSQSSFCMPFHACVLSTCSLGAALSVWLQRMVTRGSPWLSCCVGMQIKVERMAQESRVQNAMQEQERQFGRMTRSISGA